MRLSAFAVLIVFAADTGHAFACDNLAPWSRLPETGSQIFAPVPVSLIAISPLAPLTMAPSDADYKLHLFAQRDLHGRPNAEPVSVYTPFVLPLIVAGVDGVAHAVDACSVARPTSAMLQAMSITFVLVTSLKFAAGRSWPSGGLDPKAPQYLEHPEFARRFHWFSWNQGTAWPSGHTAIMVTAATALSTVEYGRSLWGYAAYAAAGGVAVGMWLGDHHWASDIVSGTLLGVAIGRSVGLAFRPESPGTSNSNYVLLPLVNPSIAGLQVLAHW